jgi:hypothetical protein
VDVLKKRGYRGVAKEYQSYREKKNEIRIVLLVKSVNAELFDNCDETDN